jgi:hypothetical protein
MIVCSQCGAIKKEVNHWFLAWTDKGGRRFCFMRMDDDPGMATEEGVRTLCGQWCLHQEVQKHTDSAEKSHAGLRHPSKEDSHSLSIGLP